MILNLNPKLLTPKFPFYQTSKSHVLRLLAKSEQSQPINQIYWTNLRFIYYFYVNKYPHRDVHVRHSRLAILQVLESLLSASCIAARPLESIIHICNQNPEIISHLSRGLHFDSDSPIFKFGTWN